jgi:CheY-like chemotaxis protein
MTGHSHYRLVFGLGAALILVVILAGHLAGHVKVDTVVLSLLVGIVASIGFALSDRLGIAVKEITAGPFKFDFLEHAQKAADAMPPEQRGQLAEALRDHSDIFPVVGARVLWVDDHHEALVAHRQVLRRLGIQVVAARSTEEATKELERDSDFVLLIQDNLRNGSNEDAKALVRWLGQQSVRRDRPAIPLFVYSFDRFDASLGVAEQDWSTQDFSALFRKVAHRLREWKQKPPETRLKPP